MALWDRFRNMADWVFDMGTVQGSSTDDDGAAQAQADNYGAGGTGYESHHPFGFVARPLDPDPTGACVALQAHEGDRGHIWPLGDARYTKNLPKLKKGASCQYGGAPGAPGFDSFDGDNGTKTIYVGYNLDGSGKPQKAMLIALDVSTAGKESIQIIHGDGMAITMAAGGKNSVVISNKKGDAYIEVNDKGIVLNGNLSVMGGASLGVNAVAGDLTQPLVNETTLLAWLNGPFALAMATPAPAKTVPPLVPGIVGCKFAKGL